MNQIENSYAIVIGINNYTNNIKCLKTAVNDAKRFTKILRELHQYQVLELLDTNATLDRLNNLVENLKQGRLPLETGTIKIAKNDRVLFYFAGHGTIDRDKLERKDELAGSLLPQDAHKGDENSFLPMHLLHDALVAMDCHHLLVILDCCFAGAFHWSSLTREAREREASKMYREKYKRYINSCAQQVIASAAHDETAVDYIPSSGACLGNRGVGSIGDHSPFAEILFEALEEGKGDVMKNGVITASELYLYLEGKLGDRVDKQTVGLRQLKNHEKGEFIFLLPDFDPEKLENAPLLDENTNPYRGLEPYEFENNKLFFGRKRAIDNLKSHLLNSDKPPLTVVCGASGTGKSSLVKAGLLPLLSGEQWHILNPMRPNSSPFTALASTISPIINQSIPKDSNYIHDLSQELREPQFFIKEINKWGCNNSSKLLLVIDQFEELLTMCQPKKRKEEEEFLDLLKALLTDCSQYLRILITLRSDFEYYFSNKLLSSNRWTAARFVVPLMERDELREVIVKPAEEKLLSFDPPGLVEQLLDEVALTQTSALSLLSLTLSELYSKYLHRRDSDRALKQQDYDDLDGVAGSLTTIATREYKLLIMKDSAYEKTVRQVMLRMVSLEVEGPARRRVLRSELNYPDPDENNRVETVIKRFSDNRLLVGGSDSHGKLYVEPAHDTLVRRWGKLQEWERENRTTIELQRQLTPAAVDWKNNKQLQQFLWHTNPKIDVLKDDVLNSNNNWLNTVETEFVQQSLRQKNKDRGIRIAVSLVLLTFFISTLTSVATVLLNLTNKPNTIFVSPGQKIKGSTDFVFSYNPATQKTNSGVSNQIVLGIPQNVPYCINVGQLPDGEQVGKGTPIDILVPKEPGVYYIEFAIDLDYFCDEKHTDRWVYGQYENVSKEDKKVSGTHENAPGKSKIGIVVVGNVFNFSIYSKILDAYLKNVPNSYAMTGDEHKRSGGYVALKNFKFEK